RYANEEAIRLHKEALSIVQSQAAGRDRDSQELAILEAVAAPLNARYGYASPELQQTLERWIALAESLGRNDSMAAGLVALWASRFVQGRSADGYQTASRVLALVAPGSELAGHAHFAIGGSAGTLGRLGEGPRHLELGGGPGGGWGGAGRRHLELAADLAGGAVWLSTGVRADVHSTAWAAHAHWLLGRDTEA